MHWSMEGARIRSTRRPTGSGRRVERAGKPTPVRVVAQRYRAPPARCSGGRSRRRGAARRAAGRIRGGPKAPAARGAAVVVERRRGSPAGGGAAARSASSGSAAKHEDDRPAPLRVTRAASTVLEYPFRSIRSISTPLSTWPAIPRRATFSTRTSSGVPSTRCALRAACSSAARRWRRGGGTASGPPGATKERPAARRRRRGRRRPAGRRARPRRPAPAAAGGLCGHCCPTQVRRCGRTPPSTARPATPGRGR